MMYPLINWAHEYQLMEKQINLVLVIVMKHIQHHMYHIVHQIHVVHKYHTLQRGLGQMELQIHSQLIQLVVQNQWKVIM